MEAPLPIYILLPRVSYLPLVTSRVRDHFINSAPAVRGDMWFDYEGKPLKWNLPIGVLFDLLHCNKSLPVDITVHFTGYPEGEILPCKSLSTVSEHFFHCLKEACFLKYGSSANVMNMAQSVHKKIEQSLVTADYKTFDEASKEILRGGEGKNNTQRLPVRIFLGDGVGSTGQCSVIQPSLSLKCPKGNPHTLQSAKSFSIYRS
eukprot:CAMPEP_0167828566 /NCGR_PEP_ID=MMETSP0112_2-20121227/11517_1 /TAXON_ID=91324 /ORGANISM="Lotharella globosa, Strain CCCM811" /LENGTH=203 /DNA_ID=CAMNT_0007731847 /DNA_START=1 /DNA_END=612 /DNA_ORIENTATION=+